MRSLLAYVFFFMLATNLLSQEAGVNRDRAHEILRQLDLSPLQKEKVDQLRLKYRDLFEHNTRTTPVRKERMEKRGQLQRDLRFEMKTILTPTQQRKFKELNRKNAENGSKPGLQESIKWAEPSPKQQEQIGSLLEEQKLKARLVRQQSMPLDERRVKMNEIKKETIAALRQILSPDQFQKFEEHVNHRINRTAD